MSAGTVGDSTDRIAYLLARLKSLHARDDQRVDAGILVAREEVHVFRDDPRDSLFPSRGFNCGAVLASIPDQEPQVYGEEDGVE
jgi:hypothetical protein